MIGHTDFNLVIKDYLTEVLHFKTELTTKDIPQQVIEFRNWIKNADGIVICNPEYGFSILSGLKNTIDWCV